MEPIPLLQTLTNMSSSGHAVVQLGSPGFTIHQARNMSSEERTAIIASWSRALNRVFGRRSLENICWAFGAKLHREIRPEKIQPMCNVLCRWISLCANDVIDLHTYGILDATGAAVWGAVLGAATEMIYQFVHEEGFNSRRFIAKPELAAGLPCPTGCGKHLRHAHGGCCDAVCPCGAIVEEKKTTKSLEQASGNVPSGALDSATHEALARTWFFIHARGGQSFKLAPGQWDRRPVVCTGTDCDEVATHNAPGEKCGLMCATCCPEHWEPARQVNTLLHFDHRLATRIDGKQELMASLGREDVGVPAFVLRSCQVACIDLWKERDSELLSDRQRLWQTCLPTNWERQLRNWWPDSDTDKDTW